MLTINIICVGKLKEEYLRMASNEYQKRLTSFCKLNIIELAEYKLQNENSDAQIEKCITVEGDAIFQKLKGKVFSLCIEGEQLTSEELSETINTLCIDGASELSFVIGGSHGLSDKVKSAGMRLSMSKLTFPHQLARVMLLEQIYRAFQISSNTKYHK